MFKTVLTKLHEHSHTGIKYTYNTFSQNNYILFLEKWFSIFIHDCIECQRNQHFNMKIQTAPTQSISEHAPFFNYRNSMNTKRPINHPSPNITQKLQPKLSYTIGFLNLDYPYILILIVDQNM